MTDIATRPRKRIKKPLIISLLVLPVLLISVVAVTFYTSVGKTMWEISAAHSKLEAALDAQNAEDAKAATVTLISLFKSIVDKGKKYGDESGWKSSIKTMLSYLEGVKKKVLDGKFDDAKAFLSKVDELTKSAHKKYRGY